MIIASVVEKEQTEEMNEVDVQKPKLKHIKMLREKPVVDRVFSCDAASRALPCRCVATKNGSEVKARLTTRGYEQELLGVTRTSTVVRRR